MGYKNNADRLFTPDQLANTLEFVEFKDLIAVIADKDRLYSKVEMRGLLETELRKEVDV